MTGYILFVRRCCALDLFGVGYTTDVSYIFIKNKAPERLDRHNGHSAISCNTFPSPDNDEIATELHEP